jgi:hypothetical protein
MIGDQSSRLKMVQDLSPDSLVLHATLEKFIKICEEKEWKIVSFRERGQTRKLVKVCFPYGLMSFPPKPAT